MPIARVTRRPAVSLSRPSSPSRRAVRSMPFSSSRRVRWVTAACRFSVSAGRDSPRARSWAVSGGSSSITAAAAPASSTARDSAAAGPGDSRFSRRRHRGSASAESSAAARICIIRARSTCRSSHAARIPPAEKKISRQ